MDGGRRRSAGDTFGWGWRGMKAIRPASCAPGVEQIYFGDCCSGSGRSFSNLGNGGPAEREGVIRTGV